MGKRRRRSRDTWWKQSVGGISVAALLAVVFGVVLAGTVVTAFALRPASDAAAPAPSYSPAASYSFQDDPADAAPRVVFIGDSYTGGSEEDSGPDARWPGLIDQELGLRGAVLARGGSGYLTVGPTGEALPAVVPEIPTDATLIVIFGSRNDVATSSEVEIAANAMFDAVQVQAPSARVLVVGPAWITSDPPDNLLASDDGLAAAAGAHGFDFVSALDAGVLADRADLIGEDGVHPNDAGHAVLAGFISPLVAERVAG